MTKKVLCGICHTEQEVIRIIPEGDSTRLVLKCTHEHTDISRSIMEPPIPIEDNVSAETYHLVSFKNDYDEVEGIYALIEGKMGFTAIDVNKFYLTNEQIDFLKTKDIVVESVK